MYIHVCLCPYSKMWEQRPLLLSRHKPHYNDGWFSIKELDRILREVCTMCMCIYDRIYRLFSTNYVEK